MKFDGCTNTVRQRCSAGTIIPSTSKGFHTTLNVIFSSYLNNRHRRFQHYPCIVTRTMFYNWLQHTILIINFSSVDKILAVTVTTVVSLYHTWTVDNHSLHWIIRESPHTHDSFDLFLKHRIVGKVEIGIHSDDRYACDTKRENEKQSITKSRLPAWPSSNGSKNCLRFKCWRLKRSTECRDVRLGSIIPCPDS